MDRVNADLRQLDNLDIGARSRPISTPPPGRTLSPSDKEMLKSALELGKVFKPETGFLLEPIRVRERPPAISVRLPTRVPVGMAARPTVSNITLAVGYSGSVFTVFGLTAQAGIYGSNSPELGLFASVGMGLWTNWGMAVGPAITLMFGPPSDLAGVCFAIGCDTRFMAGSIGGLLLFSSPPFRFLGIAVSLTVGPSVVPAFDVTVQVSNTVTKPLLN